MVSSSGPQGPQKLEGWCIEQSDDDRVDPQPGRDPRRRWHAESDHLQPLRSKDGTIKIAQIRRSGSMVSGEWPGGIAPPATHLGLHEKGAQQLPLRHMRAGWIMEVYAWLCIYAPTGGARYSATDPDVGSVRRHAQIIQFDAAPCGRRASQISDHKAVRHACLVGSAMLPDRPG